MDHVGVENTRDHEPSVLSWTERHPRGTLWVVGLGLVLAFAVMVPVALVLDRHVDRTRPMYEDVEAMAYLQFEVVQAGRPVQPVVVGPRDHVRVAGTRFSPRPGVTIEVRADGDGYCVQGSNKHGDTSQWVCGDGTTAPVNPSPSATAAAG